MGAYITVFPIFGCDHLQRVCVSRLMWALATYERFSILIIKAKLTLFPVCIRFYSYVLHIDGRGNNEWCYYLRSSLRFISYMWSQTIKPLNITLRISVCSFSIIQCSIQIIRTAPTLRAWMFSLSMLYTWFSVTVWHCWRCCDSRCASSINSCTLLSANLNKYII